MNPSNADAPVDHVHKAYQVQRKSGMLFIILALVLALITVTGFALLNGQNAKKSDLASQSSDIDKLYLYLQKACGVKDPIASRADAQLTQACAAVAKGSSAPQVLPSIPEPKSTTIVIRQVLPDSTINQILSAYCARHQGCKGADGKPGAGLTQAQATQAVAEYCSAHDKCRGVAGQDATPPTDDQIASAVAVYCEAHNGCVGPQGSQGPQGEPGKDGQMPNKFILSLNGVDNTCTRGDDGSDGTARYECIASAPTPTPTPTVSDTGVLPIPGNGGN